MTGLLRPTRGGVTVLGIPTDRPEQLFRKVGYCSQFDSFPRGLTGRDFIKSFLQVSGVAKNQAEEFTEAALERVDLVAAADRKIGAYSKGMRQRVRLAQSIAHQPSVLILDEPLNGLDPMVRSETIALFRQLAADGMHLIISIHGVRDEMDVEHPMQILIRCDQPSLLAARMFRSDEVVEARLHDDRHGLFVKTRNPDRFYLLLNEVVSQGEVNVESVAPVDDDLSAVYEYLIGTQ
jgi:ABC-2 type transport system ATP-binding protein